MTKKISNQKGFGVAGLILVLALGFAFLNLYTYYNPNFNLSQYTIVHWINVKIDDQRIKDLNVIQQAVEDYWNQENQLPTADGWCGRISSALHPEFAEALKPFLPENSLPHDPIERNTNKDYFYYRVDRSRYILMTSLSIPRDDGGNGKNVYNFTRCHDWPGNGVYNFQIRNF